MLRSKQDGVAEEAGEAFRLLSSWLERRVAARGSAGDVDDVVQEAFLRFGRYPVGATRRPRALLLRIAANLAVDAARRRAARGGDRMEGPGALRDLVDPSPDPAFMIDLKRTVMELPPKLRETFLLARFTPMTNEEVAAHLGISTKTVEWRISRAVSICLARLDR
jgi:RNA polymerase sigma-70 factor (ECF subfamily)